jgi:methionyl-tRNA formyltransferase
VLQRRFAIEPWLDVAGLLERCIATGVDMVGEFLAGFPDLVAQGTTQSGGSSHPAASERDHVVDWARPAVAVLNRARAAGWATPLQLRVACAPWVNGGQLTALADEVSQDTLTLYLFDPQCFPEHTLGAPGDLLRVEGGGIAVSCNPGTVVFRRIET